MVRKNPFQLRDFAPLRVSGANPLEIQLIRGNAVESRHRVHAVVMDQAGKKNHHWGNGSLPVFPRSAVKLMQAMPWMSLGIHEKYKLSSEDLAMACASHYGEKIHTERAAKWLAKIGCSESDLECGSHIPYDDEAANQLVRENKRPCQLHNNCSGKHSGMLMGCKEMGFATSGYSNFDHPYQAEVRKYLDLFTGMKLGERWGIDGCGIPTYSMPIDALGLAMARAADSKNLGSEIHNAVTALNKAIRERPLYFGGAESLCSKVVLASQGRVLAKVGAEGIYGAWIEEAGFGIALKAEDGTARAAELALLTILRWLGFDFLHEHFLHKRWTGEIVGQFYCV